MARATKTCRVCGKPYEACHTDAVVPGGFRWQDVACSKGCGDKYFKSILESRNQGQSAAPSVEVEAPKQVVRMNTVKREPISRKVNNPLSAEM